MAVSRLGQFPCAIEHTDRMDTLEIEIVPGFIECSGASYHAAPANAASPAEAASDHVKLQTIATYLHLALGKKQPFRTATSRPKLLLRVTVERPYQSLYPSVQTSISVRLPWRQFRGCFISGNKHIFYMIPIRRGDMNSVSQSDESLLSA